MDYTYEFLRKCHGLRFKAVKNATNIEGIIRVEKDGVVLCHGEETLDNFDYFHRRLGVSISSIFDFAGKGISDFEIVPRDPKTYKDWQVGDKIIKNDIVKFIIFRCGEVVLYKNRNNKCCACPDTCEELYADGYRLVLTDIEKQILEEKTWKPQDGDICYGQTNHTPQRFIFIKGQKEYMLVDLSNSGYKLDMDRDWGYTHIRPATDEEKQKLFDALAKEGKRWNEEKKCIEDIPAPHEFREYDPVLVRDNDRQKWNLYAFERYQEGAYCPYVCKENLAWRQCLPYNRDTEILLNTSNPYTLNR